MSFPLPAWYRAPPRLMTGNRVRRHLFPALCLLALAGCEYSEPIGAGLAVGSIVVFGRAPTDMAVSAATGRDCSIVNLDRREPYCRPREQPPEPQPFCTRSLGVVDCWDVGKRPLNPPRDVADGPRALTPEQEAIRSRWWPGLW